MKTEKLNIGYKFADGSKIWLNEPKPKARKPFKAKAATLTFNKQTGKMELSSPVSPGDTVTLNGFPATGTYNVGKYILKVEKGIVKEFVSLKELVNKGI